MSPNMTNDHKIDIDGQIWHKLPFSRGPHTQTGRGTRTVCYGVVMYTSVLIECVLISIKSNIK